MKINETACGYYKLDDEKNNGLFIAVAPGSVSSNQVKVGQAFMVEASSSSDKLYLNQGSKDANGFNNDIIRLEVSNSKYTDLAYVCFGNSLPLTENTTGAPLGSGLIILSALGAGYAVARKRKK